MLEISEGLQGFEWLCRHLKCSQVQQWQSLKASKDIVAVSDSKILTSPTVEISGGLQGFGGDCQSFLEASKNISGSADDFWRPPGIVVAVQKFSGGLQEIWWQ